MKNTVLGFFILLSFGIFAQNTTNVKFVCDKSQSTITYDMNHPLHEWTGESKEVNSIILMDEKMENILQVAVSAKISSFDSQNSNRDSHMMEVTEALKYPNVTFTSSELKLSGSNFEANGNMTFHGVVQPVKISGSFIRKGNNLTFSGEFSLKMTQFNVEPPSLMAIATDDDFKLNFKVVYKKQ